MFNDAMSLLRYSITAYDNATRMSLREPRRISVEAIADIQTFARAAALILRLCEELTKIFCTGKDRWQTRFDFVVIRCVDLRKKRHQTYIVVVLMSRYFMIYSLLKYPF